MGTGPFAVPTFQSLIDSDHDVCALVTRPPRGRRNRRNAGENPMRSVAKACGIPVLLPEDVNTAEARGQLAERDPELLVVCDYGQILSSESLRIAPLGGINLHASMLPHYRGAAPINWAIFHGEATTGVTVIQMTSRLDAGACLVQRSTPIGEEETAVKLEQRLAQLGVGAVHEAIDVLVSPAEADRVGIPQDDAAASRAPRLKKCDGQVNWMRTSQQIKNQIRAMQPWPKTYTHWRRSGKEPLRLILDQVGVAEGPHQAVHPGGVVHSDRAQLVIATGDGAISLQSIQLAGKRPMPIAEFLRGHPVDPDDQFGPFPASGA